MISVKNGYHIIIFNKLNLRINNIIRWSIHHMNVIGQYSFENGDDKIQVI